MTKTKNPWNTAGWKKRRAEILAIRDKCEWCGLTQAESLEKHKKGLSIDHIQSRSTGLKLWHEVAAGLHKKYAETHGLRVSFSIFSKSYKPEIDTEFDRRRKEYSFERYMELRDEDIQVLCLRCHAVKTSGGVLCPKCKKNYVHPDFGACKECNKDKIEQRRIERMREAEKRVMAHARADRHHREFNYGVEHPDLRHLRLWHCIECSEPINFQHLCAYQSCDVCLARLYESESTSEDGYIQEEKLNEENKIGEGSRAHEGMAQG